MVSSHKICRSFTILWLLTTLICLAACGEITASSTPTPPPSPQITPILPTVTSVPATPTPVPASPTVLLTVTATPVLSPTQISSHFPGRIVVAYPAGQISIIDPKNPGGIAIGNNVLGFSPIFSPDGARIAYIGGNVSEQQKGIFAANLDGSNQQNYCPDPARFGQTLVRWSPDGRNIAFTHSQQDGSITSFWCDTTTNKITQVKSSLSENVEFYDWAATGDFALWSSLTKEGHFNLYYGELAKAEAATLLISQDSRFLSSRIAPDGKTIAVIQDQYKVLFFGVPGQTSLLNGKSFAPPPQQYLTQKVTQLAWSPDGQTMLLSIPDSTHGYGFLVLFSLTPAQFGQPIKNLTGITLKVDWSRK